MSYTPVPLSADALPGALTTLYTVGGGAVVIVKEILLVNTSQADKQAFIYFVPSGGSALPANAVVYNVTVSPGNPLVIPLSTPLAAGDFIAGNQGSTGISCRISGVVGP